MRVRERPHGDHGVRGSRASQQRLRERAGGPGPTGRGSEGSGASTAGDRPASRRGAVGAPLPTRSGGRHARATGGGAGGEPGRTVLRTTGGATARRRAIGRSARGPGPRASSGCRQRGRPRAARDRRRGAQRPHRGAGQRPCRGRTRAAVAIRTAGTFLCVASRFPSRRGARHVGAGRARQPEGRRGMGAAGRAAIDAGRHRRRGGCGRASRRHGAPECASPRRAGVRGAGAVEPRTRTGSLRPRDRAGQQRPAGEARPWVGQDSHRQSRRRPQPVRGGHGPGSGQRARTELSRQGLFRGATRTTGWRTVRPRQGSRCQRPHVPVLRRDPETDLESAGRSAAGSDRGDPPERWSRRISLPVPPGSGPGGT